ncbi:MAG: desaturase [Barrevirus sp.]|uniref:Desaturase n=1 Tax=Barrevirus sp. TaxID=2487763 RepID=A0A3G4ZTD5_9VIRU|nr:MAG: desaturase [Barrevirus sp.]
MLANFIIIIVGIIVLGIIERLFPKQELPTKQWWYVRACLFNIGQFIVVLLGHYTWEHWIIGDHSLFKFRDLYSPFIGGFIAYIFNAWLFYWWHRWRHENRLIWLIFHQFHHSPERIEVITSFYKHPFEIIMNSIIITFAMYPILGLSIEQNAYMTLLSAFAEFFYHMNVRTPYWLGYIIQRPESHCLHHLRDKRYCKNYSDIPLFDMLGGTFENPKDNNFEIGFSDNREMKVKEMLLCKNMLNKPNKNKHDFNKLVFALLIIIGLLHSFGHVNNLHNIKGISFASAASPLPLVFSEYNGVETFSTTFELDLTFHNGSHIKKLIDNKLYGNLKGNYNRRNMYGVIFSHGPFFNIKNSLIMRQQILHYGLCSPGHLAYEFGIFDKLKHVVIYIRSNTKGNEDKMWKIDVAC